MTLNPQHGIAVFSDGSSYCKDRSGGWGWVALDAFDGLAQSSGGFTDATNNRMELYAATNALMSLTAYGAIDVLVFSDSEYVVLGMQNKTRKRNANKKWWADLEDAVSRHSYVEFEWVKGHVGNKYNELADQLARQARRSSI